MAAPLTANRVSVEEYLSNPEYEHSEYIDGEILELNVGGKPHGNIQVNFGIALKQYAKSHPGMYVGTEVHCRLTVEGRTRFRLPDVAVLLHDTDPSARFIDGAPDLAVEVRSPEDTLASQVRKFKEYFANGCKLGWFAIPEEKTILVLRPGAEDQVLTSGETLDGGDLLPGFSAPVDDIFS
jgi:Uma2 family endonuclease